jgi:putative ABC transport system ATP-binding protein
MHIFERLNRTQGISIVLVTHSDEIATHADRIIGLRDGLVVSDAPVTRSRKTSENLVAVLRVPVEAPQ